ALHRSRLAFQPNKPRKVPQPREKSEQYQLKLGHPDPLPAAALLGVSAAGVGSRLCRLRPRVSGSIRSMMIISPEAKVLNTAMATPSPKLSLRKPTSVGNSAPIARPAL